MRIQNCNDHGGFNEIQPCRTIPKVERGPHELK